MERTSGISWLLLIMLIAYIISPIDAMPGPIDDILLCVAYGIINRRQVTQQF